MKPYLLITLLVFIANFCNAQNCNEGINNLPMYGLVEKCPAQLLADKNFLKYCDDNYNSRADAALQCINKAWDYVNRNILDTAMMRFNQAWLLDSLNAEIYWGYANMYGIQNKFKESLPYFEKATKLKPDNHRIWYDSSLSYGNMFFQTKDKKYLNKTISALKKAIALKPKVAIYNAQLATTYFYITQIDSARKYLKIADQIDPKVVNPEIRAMLRQ